MQSSRPATRNGLETVRASKPKTNFNQQGIRADTPHDALSAEEARLTSGVSLASVPYNEELEKSKISAITEIPEEQKKRPQLTEFEK